MEDCFSDSVARGHHVFKSVWTHSLGESLTLGEVLSVKEEEDNEHDIFAVSFEKAGMIVGHVPHEVSTRHGGSIICEVTGHRTVREDWARLLGLTMQQFGRGQHLCAHALNKKRL